MSKAEAFAKAVIDLDNLRLEVKCGAFQMGRGPNFWVDREGKFRINADIIDPGEVQKIIDWLRDTFLTGDEAK